MYVADNKAITGSHEHYNITSLKPSQSSLTNATRKVKTRVEISTKFLRLVPKKREYQNLSFVSYASYGRVYANLRETINR